MEEKRTMGREALSQNIQAVKTLGNIIKSTLGPKGMDKMLLSADGRLTLTNDGVTIIDKMKIDHPAGQIIKQAAKTQEKEVGDGTTSIVMLAGELLSNAETLINENIHPTIIIKGYELARKKVLEILKEISIKTNERNILEKVAQTALTGKSAESLREELSKIIVDAVEISGIEKIDFEGIKIVKSTSETEKAELVRGVVLQKEVYNDSMPKDIKKPKIALIDYDLEIKNMNRDSQIQITNPNQFKEFLDAEQNQLDELIKQIKESGANVVFCNKGIDEYVFSQFARVGILAIRRIMKGDMERLSRATNGKIASNPSELCSEVLGSCGRIYQKKFKEESLIFVEDCENPRDVSIVVYGTTDHSVDEIGRAITDALGDVISTNQSVVAGGGAVEMEISKKLREYSRTLSGREQLAVDKFADALESIPKTLAQNAGLDSINILTELRSKHEEGKSTHGLNLFNDKIEDTYVVGIIEPTKNKTQAISSATEVAKMVLRCDDILVSKPENN